MSSRLSAQRATVELNNYNTRKNQSSSLLLKQEMGNFLAQIQLLQNNATQVINSIFSQNNFIKALEYYSENCLQQASYFCNEATSVSYQSEIFHLLQNIITNAQSSQENSNAAFALASSAQMQSQAVQNIANAVFLIYQRMQQVSDAESNVMDHDISNIMDQAHNFNLSARSIADSAQNYYFNMQNAAEKMQQITSQIYEMSNKVSAELDC